MYRLQRQSPIDILTLRDIKRHIFSINCENSLPKVVPNFPLYRHIWESKLNPGNITEDQEICLRWQRCCSTVWHSSATCVVWRSRQITFHVIMHVYDITVQKTNYYTQEAFFHKIFKLFFLVCLLLFFPCTSQKYSYLFIGTVNRKLQNMTVHLIYLNITFIITSLYLIINK